MTPHRNRWFVVLLLLLLLLLAQQRMQKKWIYLRFSCDVVFLCQCWPTLCVVDIVSLSPRSFSVFINADSGSYFAPQHCRWVYLCRSTFTTRARLLLLQLLLLYVQRANGFCGGFPRRFETKARGRVGTNGIRIRTDGRRFAFTDETDFRTQKHTHTMNHGEEKGGKGNDEWWPLFGKFRMCGKWMRQICLWCCSFKYDFWRCYYYVRQIFHFEMNCWVDVFLFDFRWDVEMVVGMLAIVSVVVLIRSKSFHL